MTLVDRIIAELRHRGSIPYDELERLVSPPRDRESETRRVARHNAFVRAVSRARYALHREGKTIVSMPIEGARRRFGLSLWELAQ